MRNDLLNTARGAHKHAQKTPKATQKPRPLSEAVLSDAVGTVFGTDVTEVRGSGQRVENLLRAIF